MHYPIAIIQKNGVFYGVLPDLPDIRIKAYDIVSVISQARLYIIQYLYELAANEQPLPSGSDISIHLTHIIDEKNKRHKFAGWTWAIVSIDAARILGSEISLTIDIPERLVHRAQAYLQKKSTTEYAKDTSTSHLPNLALNECILDSNIDPIHLNQLIIKALSTYLKNNIDT